MGSEMCIRDRGGYRDRTYQRGWRQRGRRSSRILQDANRRIGGRRKSGELRKDAEGEDPEKGKNGGGSTLQNSAAPAAGSLRAQGTLSRNGTRLDAFLSNTRRGMVCGVCRVTLQRGHQAVRLAVDKHVTCFTGAVWWRPSLEAGHRHPPVAQSSPGEPDTQDRTHWRQRSKQDRVFTVAVSYTHLTLPTKA